MSWVSVTTKGSEESWDWGYPKWLTKWPRAIPPQGFSQSGSPGLLPGPWSHSSLICSQGPCVGPTVARVCVDIYSTCYHRGLWRCPGLGTLVGLGSLVGVQEASCSWSDTDLRSLCCHPEPWWHQNPGADEDHAWVCRPLKARVYVDVHGLWCQQRHMDAQGLGHNLWPRWYPRAVQTSSAATQTHILALQLAL